VKKIEAPKTVKQLADEVVALLEKANLFKRRSLATLARVGKVLGEIKQQLKGEFTAWIDKQMYLPTHKMCCKYMTLAAWWRELQPWLEKTDPEEWTLDNAITHIDDNFRKKKNRPAVCHVCAREVGTTLFGEYYRVHNDKSGARCEASGELVKVNEPGELVRVNVPEPHEPEEVPPARSNMSPKPPSPPVHPTNTPPTAEMLEALDDEDEPQDEPTSPPSPSSPPAKRGGYCPDCGRCVAVTPLGRCEKHYNKASNNSHEVCKGTGRAVVFSTGVTHQIYAQPTTRATTSTDREGKHKVAVAFPDNANGEAILEMTHKELTALIEFLTDLL
jgi:hypothetical protein